MLITWNLDTDTLNVGLGVNASFVSELRAPVGSLQQVRIGFYRPTGTTTAYIDIGATPEIEFIVKEATGSDRFDDAPVIASPTFTRETVDSLGNYFYVGYLDLSAPGVIKRLGVDNAYAKEAWSLSCVANDIQRLSGKYFDIYTTASAYTRHWFSVTGAASTAPAAGTGGTLYQITIANSISAAAVAAAVETAIDITLSGVSSISGSVVSFTHATYGFLGISSAGTTGFAFTLITSGMSSSNTTDVEEYEFAAQLKYETDGSQVSDIFSLVVENSLYRSGNTYPLGSTAAFYRSGTVVCGTTETVTVTFSSALSAATYTILESSIRYTGAGSPPYALGVLTIASKTTAGFVAYLNGNSTTDYSLDYKVTL